MASASGLGYEQRIRCRDRVVQAANLALAHKTQVHYSMESDRWDGIKNRRNALKAEFPIHSDCSSFATWCLWNGLFLKYGLGDRVNGQSWEAGYTGTMREHGTSVRIGGTLLRGDCVFYGGDGMPNHVAIVVATKGVTVPMVISHGTEAGPFYVRFNYRTPRQIQRYI